VLLYIYKIVVIFGDIECHEKYFKFVER